MSKLLLLLLLFPLIFACEGNTAARKTARGENFVSDPDHLYFKNTRARHYAAEEVAERATIYRHDALFASDANLRPALIDNWLQDRAVVRFELEGVAPGWALEAKDDDGWRRVPLSTPPTNEELGALNGILLGNAGLRIIARKDTLPAFSESSGRKEARTVLTDYLRLVGYGG